MRNAHPERILSDKHTDRGMTYPHTRVCGYVAALEAWVGLVDELERNTRIGGVSVSDSPVMMSLGCRADL